MEKSFAKLKRKNKSFANLDLETDCDVAKITL